MLSKRQQHKKHPGFNILAEGEWLGKDLLFVLLQQLIAALFSQQSVPTHPIQHSVEAKFLGQWRPVW